MLDDLVEMQSEEMDLRLAERSARRLYALEFPGMAPRHRRPHGDAVVFRDRLDVLKPEVCERSSKPGSRGKEAINPFRVPILLLRIVFRFPVHEIRSDDLIRLAGFNQTKRGDRNILVLLEAHSALRALVC